MKQEFSRSYTKQRCCWQLLQATMLPAIRSSVYSWATVVSNTQLHNYLSYMRQLCCQQQSCLMYQPPKTPWGISAMYIITTQLYLQVVLLYNWYTHTSDRTLPKDTSTQAVDTGRPTPTQEPSPNTSDVSSGYMLGAGRYIRVHLHI